MKPSVTWAAVVVAWCVLTVALMAGWRDTFVTQERWAAALRQQALQGAAWRDALTQRLEALDRRLIQCGAGE